MRLNLDLTELKTLVANAEAALKAVENYSMSKAVTVVHDVEADAETAVSKVESFGEGILHEVEGVFEGTTTAAPAQPAP